VVDVSVCPSFQRWACFLASELAFRGSGLRGEFSELFSFFEKWIRRLFDVNVGKSKQALADARLLGF
jgi:hypothetical protein